jgi:hypothetical protein
LPLLLPWRRSPCFCCAVSVPAYAGTRQDLPVSPGKALDAVISSKVRQLVVLKRDLERFNCGAPADEPSLEDCRQ